MLSQQDIDQINAMFVGLESSIRQCDAQAKALGEDLSESLALARRRAESAQSAIGRLSSQADAIRAAATHVLVGELRDPIRALAEHLDEFADDALEKSGSAQSAGSLQGATQRIQQAREVIAQSIEDCGASLEAVMQDLGDKVIEIDAAAQMQTNELIASTNTQLAEFQTHVSEEVLELVEQSTADAEAHVEAEIENTKDAIEEQIELLSETLSENLTAVIETLAKAVRGGLQHMREEIEGGDAEGRSRYEELETAIETIKEAIPPLDSALQAFKSLAGAVGIRV